MVFGQQLHIDTDISYPVPMMGYNIDLFSAKESTEMTRIATISESRRQSTKIPEKWSDYDDNNEDGCKKRYKVVLPDTDISRKLGRVDISTCDEMLEDADNFATYCKKIVSNIRKAVDEDTIAKKMYILDYLTEKASKQFLSRITLDPLVDTLRSMLTRGDYVSAMEMVEFCTRKYKLVSNYYRVDMLSVLMRCSDLEITERSKCFVRFFEAFIETGKGRHPKYLNECFGKLCEFYETSDDETIRSFTTPPVLVMLFKLLESRLNGRQNWHFMKLCRILTIICAHVEEAPSFLMRLGIGANLLKFYMEFYCFEKTIEIDIIFCLWALTPALRFNEEMFRAVVDPIKVDNLSFLDGKGKKIIFPFHLTQLTELHIANKSKEFTVIIKGLNYTINLEKMTITNEATSIERELTSICRRKFIPPKLSKMNNGGVQKTLLHDFVAIAYRMLYKIYSRNIYVQIQYVCLETLLSILIYMDESDFDEIVCRNRESETSIWTSNELIILVSHGFESDNKYVRMVSSQILAVCMSRRKETFSRLCSRHGVLYKLPRMERPDSNRDIPPTETEDLSIWMDAAFEAMIEDFNEDLHVPVQQLEATVENNSETCLRRIRSALMGENITDFEVSLIMGGLLEYLTAGEYDDEDKSSRFRTFLNVFGILPSDPHTTDFEIGEEPFKRLLNRMQDILFHFCKFDQVGDVHKREDPLRASLRTLARLSSKIMRIDFVSTDRSTSFAHIAVFPFTTIDFLENFILSHVAPAEEYKDGHHVNRNKQIHFYFEEILVPSTLTLYEVIKKFRKDTTSDIFATTHCVIYAVEDRHDDHCRDFVSMKHPLDAFTRNLSKGHQAYAANFEQGEQALRIIHVLYGLNRHWMSLYKYADQRYLVDPETFVVEHLNDIAEYAMEDPFGVLVGQLPRWIDIMDICPFIFSEKTRRTSLIVRSMDRHRAFKYVIQNVRSATGHIGFSNTSIARVNCRRDHILRDIETALQTTRPMSHWTATFEGEAGIGPGPVRELFTLAARELQSINLRIWVGSENSDTGYINVEEGLYPVVNPGLQKQESPIFKTMGQMIGKAVLERQMLDIPFAIPFYKWILHEEQSLTLNDLKYVSPSVFHVLKGIDKLLMEYERILADTSEEDKESSIKDLTMERSTLESYGLTFVLPGHDDIELIEDGANVSVCLENAREFIENVTQVFLRGVEKQMNAVKRGIDSMLDINSLRAFSPEELNRLLYGDGSEEYWTMDHLRESTYLIGFDLSCPEVQHFLTAISSLKKKKRKHFLEFLTGSPSLPVGGFKNLTPQFTIMKCDNIPPHVQTCFNRIMTPSNVSRKEVKRFLHLGITEGRNFFGLA